MLKKCGQVEQAKTKSLEILIKNPIGATYRVNFTMSYVWSLLDGKTDITKIAEKIQMTCNYIDLEGTKKIVTSICNELRKVGLATEVKKDIHKVTNPL